MPDSNLKPDSYPTPDPDPSPNTTTSISTYAVCQLSYTQRYQALRDSEEEKARRMQTTKEEEERNKQRQVEEQQNALDEAWARVLGSSRVTIALVTTSEGCD